MGFSPERSQWEKLAKTVPAASTIVVDVLPLASFKLAKFVVQMQNVPNNKYKSLEILASRRGASQVNDSVYAKVGDSINVSLNVLVSGSDVQLQAVNAESFDVDLTVTKTT